MKTHLESFLENTKHEDIDLTQKGACKSGIVNQTMML